MSENTINPARSERKAVDKMNFEELRAYVEEMDNRFIQMQRRYEDLLYNLDTDNLSTPLYEKTVKMSAKNAEGVAELGVTANCITSAVYSNPVELDEEWTEDGKEKDKIYHCTKDNLYYYWNHNEWISTTNATFGTVFTQTATGFELSGDVTVKGDINTTKDCTVGDNLYLGSSGDKSHTISFSEQAKISNYESPTSEIYAGLKFDCSVFFIKCADSNIYFYKDGEVISLGNYISEIVSSMLP